MDGGCPRDAHDVLIGWLVCFKARASGESRAQRKLGVPVWASSSWRRIVLKRGFVAFALVVASDLACATNPVLRVILKNESKDGSVAQLVLETNNEWTTWSTTSPHPSMGVGAEEVDAFDVLPLLSPAANVGEVTYQIGRERCRFRSAYVAGLANQKPQWTKTAKGSSSTLKCKADIGHIDPITHAWTVQFAIEHVAKNTLNREESR